MDLNTVANVATALTLLVALIFGVMQLRQIERRRRDTSAMETMHTFQTPELRDAFRSVLSVAEPMTQQTISSSRELADAAEVIIYAGESLGALVFERVVSLHALDRLLGGFLRMSWRRLAPYIEAERKLRGPHLAEWFQWLVERLDEHPAPGKARGAYISHRAWRP